MLDPWPRPPRHSVAGGVAGVAPWGSMGGSAGWLGPDVRFYYRRMKRKIRVRGDFVFLEASVVER